jgi:hypothetical protein
MTLGKLSRRMKSEICVLPLYFSLVFRSDLLVNILLKCPDLVEVTLCIGTGVQIIGVKTLSNSFPLMIPIPAEERLTKLPDGPPLILKKLSPNRAPYPRLHTMLPHNHRFPPQARTHGALWLKVMHPQDRAVRHKILAEIVNGVLCNRGRARLLFPRGLDRDVS